MSKPTDLALLVLILGEAGGPIIGRKRLQKTVCLLKFQNKLPFSFQFKPYFYGPYSEQLAEAMEVLKSSNIINEESEMLPNGILRYSYALTDFGKRLHKRLAGEDDDFAEKIRSSIDTIVKLPTGELVKLSKQFVRSDST